MSEIITIQITRALHGGYLVSRPDYIDLGRIGTFQLLFSGSLPECLTYIDGQFSPGTSEVQWKSND